MVWVIFINVIIEEVNIFQTLKACLCRKVHFSPFFIFKCINFRGMDLPVDYQRTISNCFLRFTQLHLNVSVEHKNSFDFFHVFDYLLSLEVF